MTGVKLTSKYRYDKRRDQEVLVSKKTARVTRWRNLLEDVEDHNP